MSRAPDATWSRAVALCADPRFREAVWRHCRWHGPSAPIPGALTAVHPADQVLRHCLAAFDVDRAVGQYFNVALQQHDSAQQVLRALFAERRGELRLLDFACGYGRLLRFAAPCMAPARIWASDIHAQAVEFVAQRFGVRGIVSSVAPEDFHVPHGFDFVWVASLFSHLPKRSFDAWLRRLAQVVRPGGALCFSVHDPSVLPAGMAMPADGFLFIAESEDHGLDRGEYGTTYVSEERVRASLALAAGPGWHAHRIPRALGGHQDLYVASSDARAMERLGAFRRGPWGFVDRIEVSAARELSLVGWAASFDDGALDDVEIRIDGRECHAPIDATRADVSENFADEHLARSGWQFRTRLAARESFVEVAARTSMGESALLYAAAL